MHIFDRIHGTCMPLYIPSWWRPCRSQNMLDKHEWWVFIIDCTVCWIRYCIIITLHGIWITLNMCL